MTICLAFSVIFILNPTSYICKFSLCLHFGPICPILCCHCLAHKPGLQANDVWGGGSFRGDHNPRSLPPPPWWRRRSSTAPPAAAAPPTSPSAGPTQVRCGRAGRWWVGVRVGGVSFSLSLEQMEGIHLYRIENFMSDFFVTNSVLILNVFFLNISSSFSLLIFLFLCSRKILSSFCTCLKMSFGLNQNQTENFSYLVSPATCFSENITVGSAVYKYSFAGTCIAAGSGAVAPTGSLFS